MRTAEKEWTEVVVWCTKVSRRRRQAMTGPTNGREDRSSVHNWILRVPYSVVEAIVWSIIVYYTVFFSPSVGRFFRYVFVLFSMHHMDLGIFRTLAVVARNVIIANTFGSAALLVVFLLGGFIMPKDMCFTGWWSLLASLLSPTSFRKIMMHEIQIRPLVEPTNIIKDHPRLQYSWRDLVSKDNNNSLTLVSIWAPVVALIQVPLLNHLKDQTYGEMSDEFNITWLHRGDLILNVSDLSIESSMNLGLLLDQLRYQAVKSLSNMVVIILIKSLEQILYYSFQCYYNDDQELFPCLSLDFRVVFDEELGLILKLRDMMIGWIHEGFQSFFRQPNDELLKQEGAPL
ncbi:unnamed protein product [Lactuca saligna]|uniref:ABC-2 type transporter transmembrane domain-containing protein n=1 Tax=Lactuca saligna TaxID=75948 RepID=A0AA36DZS7_LACSI|nr:unnamed protein product [Lactuca saligna]